MEDMDNRNIMVANAGGKGRGRQGIWEKKRELQNCKYPWMIIYDAK
jgi:hypothetical protein